MVETGGLLEGVAVHTCNTVVDGRDRRVARGGGWASVTLLWTAETGELPGFGF